MKTALHVRTNGDILEIDLEPNSLQALQFAVNGLVQAIDINDFTMWLNEEGKMMSLPHNPFGQALWQFQYGNTDYIVGDVVITGGTNAKGETLGLTRSQVQRLRTFAQVVRNYVEPRIEVL